MRLILLFLLALLSSCSSGNQGRHGKIRIGIDADWAPLNFEKQQSYVNGYTEDLLLEVARYNGISFEKISANSDTLLDGLNKGHYDAILTSLPPYEYNTAKYDFSQNFLNTGLVLVTSQNGKYANLKDLSGELVGVVSGGPGAVALELNPKIIIRTFPSLTYTLNALAGGQIEAAVLDRLPVGAYVRDLYNGKLKIVGTPLTHSGLHVVTKKNSGYFIHSFNRTIEQMKKKQLLDSLEKKWQLQ